ncbi:MAG: hypothetical protein HY875_07440 [Chloroflexi bacterium]|nr:hypothetical protein [Chloroflexota bacterium]
MTTSTTIRRAAVGVAILSALGWATVAAQFGPPSTVWGSVTDEAGPIAAGLPVEAYVGEQLCGKGKTEFTGEGAAKVTVYYADVFSREQTPGCGFEGAQIRFKIGERFASQTAIWKAGPVQLDVTFGNVQPAVIPTFTPVPRTSTPVPGAGAQGAGAQTPGSEAGTPGATLPPAALTATATLSGGVISSATNGSDDGGSDGGFPFWGVVVLVLGGVAVIGGGAGLALARSNAAAKKANSDLED